jgi:hypothetical protein
MAQLSITNNEKKYMNCEEISIFRKFGSRCVARKDRDRLKVSQNNERWAPSQVSFIHLYKKNLNR